MNKQGMKTFIGVVTDVIRRKRNDELIYGILIFTPNLTTGEVVEKKFSRKNFRPDLHPKVLPNTVVEFHCRDNDPDAPIFTTVKLIGVINIGAVKASMIPRENVNNLRVIPDERIVSYLLEKKKTTIVSLMRNPADDDLLDRNIIGLTPFDEVVIAIDEVDNTQITNDPNYFKDIFKDGLPKLPVRRYSNTLSKRKLIATIPATTSSNDTSDVNVNDNTTGGNTPA